MKPIKFTKYETIFTGKDANILDLPTKIIEYGDGGHGIISCWKLSIIDYIRVLFGKPIYLVIMGNRLPPVLLSTDSKRIGASDDEDQEQKHIEYDPESGKVYR